MPFRLLTITTKEFLKYFANFSSILLILSFHILTWLSLIYFYKLLNIPPNDLLSFFKVLPWLYLIIIPIANVKIWAEEFKNDNIIFLLTLPTTSFELVLSKFFASTLWITINLVLTMPLWIVANINDVADNKLILANYLASILAASSLVAICLCFSAVFKNYVLVWLSSTITSLFLLTAHLFNNNWADFSITSHFLNLTNGIIELQNLIFLLSLTIIGLAINLLVIDYKKL